MKGSYVLKKGNEIVKRGNIDERLFEKLANSGIRRAVFFGNEVLYFESQQDRAVLVSVEKKNAGFAKLLARKLLGEEKKIDLKALDEVFDFAEKVKKASLDELSRLR